jgi:hypothetical protein
VKPYVKRQKNDAADAEAICEAVTRAKLLRIQGACTNQSMRNGAQVCFNDPSDNRFEEASLFMHLEKDPVVAIKARKGRRIGFSLFARLLHSNT